MLFCFYSLFDNLNVGNKIEFSKQNYKKAFISKLQVGVLTCVLLSKRSQNNFHLSLKKTKKTNVPELSKWREKKVIFIHKTIFLEALDEDGNTAAVWHCPALAHSFLMHFPSRVSFIRLFKTCKEDVLS